MAPSKVLVVGNVNGKIEELFEKLGTLNSKTKFAFAIIAGNLFADPESATNENVEAISKLLDGTVKVPLTTYFALGTHPLPKKVTFKIDAASGELCPNLFYLGRRSTTKTSEGIRIASLGGRFNEAGTSSKDIQESTYSENDAKSLKGAHNVDILVTSDWPDGVRKGSQAEFESEVAPIYQSAVSDLCLALKPRYHFTTSADTFYEREPFFHTFEEQNETFRVTRFISLAALGNSDKKKKWIYAFSIDPEAADPISLPVGTTTCPLSSSAAVNKKRTALPEQQSYRFSSDNSHATSQRPRKRRRDHAPVAPAECFFCLSNPTLATHLITSIGDSAYMTVAKGPLTVNTTFPTFPFPAHMLIIPLSHTATLSAIEDDGERHSTENEMSLFVTSLNSMIQKHAPKLGSVSWSVSRGSGVHVHWQWMPVPLELIEKGLVEAAFRVEAENEKYPRFTARKVDESEEREDSFIVRIWNLRNANGDDPHPFKDHKAIILPLDSSFRFDLQLGRRVLAKLLELDSRADWRQCGQTLEEEEKDVENFKKFFKDFDFTLNDD